MHDTTTRRPPNSGAEPVSTGATRLSERQTPPVLATLVYCIEGGRVLLLCRKRPPFQGLWVAPGGKVAAGEAPHECARRELLEETGLVATELSLRGIVRETSQRPDWQWLIFIYCTRAFTGRVNVDAPEGELRWWPIGEVDRRSIPESDALFMPRVLAEGSVPYEARFEYDASLNLCGVHELSLGQRK